MPRPFGLEVSSVAVRSFLAPSLADTAPGDTLGVLLPWPYRTARFRRRYHVRTILAVANDGNAALGVKSGIFRARSAAVI